MAVIKMKGSDGNWIRVYYDELKNRLRKDKNLSDLGDINVARENLGINGLQREFTNLALGLAANEGFDDYNAMIVVDCEEGSDDTDVANIEILSLVPGDNKATVNDASQIKVGHTYTLSDGTQQEEVKVSKVIVSGGTSTVYFENDTNYMYDDVPSLYRTTNAMDASSSSDPATIKIDCSSSTVWTGIPGGDERTVAFDTSIGNSGKMKMYGSISYTSDGAVTLIS